MNLLNSNIHLSNFTEEISRRTNDWQLVVIKFFLNKKCKKKCRITCQQRVSEFAGDELPVPVHDVEISTPQAHERNAYQSDTIGHFVPQEYDGHKSALLPQSRTARRTSFDFYKLV